MTYRELNFDEMTLFNRQVRKSKTRYPSDSHHAKVLYMRQGDFTIAAILYNDGFFGENFFGVSKRHPAEIDNIHKGELLAFTRAVEDLCERRSGSKFSGLIVPLINEKSIDKTSFNNWKKDWADKTKRTIDGVEELLTALFLLLSITIMILIDYGIKSIKFVKKRKKEGNIKAS